VPAAPLLATSSVTAIGASRQSSARSTTPRRCPPALASRSAMRRFASRSRVSPPSRKRAITFLAATDSITPRELDDHIVSAAYWRARAHLLIVAYVHLRPHTSTQLRGNGTGSGPSTVAKGCVLAGVLLPGCCTTFSGRAGVRAPAPSGACASHRRVRVPDTHSAPRRRTPSRHQLTRRWHAIRARLAGGRASRRGRGLSGSGRCTGCARSRG
jgi:hypothetical protein